MYLLANLTSEIEGRIRSSITQIFYLCRQFLISLKCLYQTDFWGILLKENFSRGGWGCILYLRNFQRDRGVQKTLGDGGGGGGFYVKFSLWWGYGYFLEPHIEIIKNIASVFWNSTQTNQLRTSQSYITTVSHFISVET